MNLRVTTLVTFVEKFSLPKISFGLIGHMRTEICQSININTGLYLSAFYAKDAVVSSSNTINKII